MKPIKRVRRDYSNHEAMSYKVKEAMGEIAWDLGVLFAQRIQDNKLTDEDKELLKKVYKLYPESMEDYISFITEGKKNYKQVMYIGDRSVQ